MTMIELSCPKCEHTWIYKGSKAPSIGKKRVYITCPSCHYSMKIDPVEVELEKVED